MITAEEARINSNRVNPKKSKTDEFLEDIYKCVEKASNDGRTSIIYRFDRKESQDTIQKVGRELTLLGYDIWAAKDVDTGGVKWLISWDSWK